MRIVAPACHSRVREMRLSLWQCRRRAASHVASRHGISYLLRRYAVFKVPDFFEMGTNIIPFASPAIKQRY